jgi:hypothetical protein
MVHVAVETSAQSALYTTLLHTALKTIGVDPHGLQWHAAGVTGGERVFSVFASSCRALP